MRQNCDGNLCQDEGLNLSKSLTSSARSDVNPFSFLTSPPMVLPTDDHVGFIAWFVSVPQYRPHSLPAKTAHRPRDRHLRQVYWMSAFRQKPALEENEPSVCYRVNADIQYFVMASGSVFLARPRPSCRIFARVSSCRSVEVVSILGSVSRTVVCLMAASMSMPCRRMVIWLTAKSSRSE